VLGSSLSWLKISAIVCTVLALGATSSPANVNGLQSDAFARLEIGHPTLASGSASGARPSAQVATNVLRPAVIRPPSGPAPAASATPHESSASSALSALHRGEDLLQAVKLGATLAQLEATAGTPWLVAHAGSGISYWAYSIDADRAWLVVTLNAARQVTAGQIVQRNKAQKSVLQDALGSTLGQSVGKPAPAKPTDLHANESVSFGAPAANGARRFHAADNNGVVFRVGLTSGTAAELPAIVRWYANTGWSPDRAIFLSAYASLGVSRYLAQLKDVPELHCGNGRHWTPGATQSVVRDGIAVDAVKATCGAGPRTSTVYFARADKAPRPFDSDPIAQQMLGRPTPAASHVNAAVTLSQRRTTASAQTGTTGTIFLKSPAPGICLNSCGDALEFSYVDDPNNPLSSATLYEVSSPTSGSSGTTAYARRVQSAGAQGAAVPVPGANCIAFAGIVKCFGGPLGPGCIIASATFGAFTKQSQPVCFLNLSDQWSVPHHDPKGGSGGCTARPIDVATGKLWYTGHDGTLSGPFGLDLSHRYDTENAAVQYDMGYGWHHSYDDYLDVSNINNPNEPGQVVCRSNTCARDYFNVQFGILYDPYSGDSLSSNGTSYTLTTWDHRILQFDSVGRLTSLTDRVGNQQTIARDTSHRITSVTDTLGRSLKYTYDGNNRVLAIHSTPAAISVTFTYDSGTGCYAGDLCSAKESDGAKWVYQYYNPASYAGNHLLLSVTDPLGHIEESNTYATENVNYTTVSHYYATQQTYNAGKNTLSYAYSPGDTEVTDANGNTSSYYWDLNSLLVTRVSGPLCNCNGTYLSYSYDDFNKLQTVQDGGTPTLTLGYSGDIVATSPDGTSSYIEQSYPKPTSYTQSGFAVLTGPSTKTTTVGYFPLGDPRQDLPQTVSEPSVDVAGQTVTTTYGYSVQGLLTSLTRAGYVNGAAVSRSVSATFDSRGRVLTATGPRTDVEQVSKYAYFSDTDADLSRRGQLQTFTDALKHTTTFGNGASPYNTYSPYGIPASSTDPNAVLTDFTFDARGRLLSQTVKGVTNDPADLRTTVAYDTAGKPTLFGKPLGNALSAAYDANDNLTSLTRLDASGLQREQAVYGYDPGSRPISTTLQSCTLPTSACSTWNAAFSSASAFSKLDQDAYDSFPTVSGDLGTTYYHGAAGDLTAAVYGASPTSSGKSYERDYTYGQNHELWTRSDGAAAQLTFNYDLQMNVVGITPSNVPITTSTFDDFGEMKTQVSPYTGTTTMTYDAAGNILSRTDGNGARTVSTYDALNRRLSAIASRTGLTTETVTWTYDSATTGAYGIGRLATMTDPTGSTAYTYERRGLLASTVQKVGTASYTTKYAYDGNGNRISATLPSTRVLIYAFDFADRPYAVKSATAVYVSAATYQPFGPLTQLSFGNGTTQAWSFNQRYKPTENKVTTTSATLFDQTYTQEASGLTSATTDKLTPANSRQYTYSFYKDVLGTVATPTNSSWASFVPFYNRNLAAMNVTDSSGNALSIGFALDSAQRLTAVQTTNAAGATTTQTVTEDNAGNETVFGTASYAYSPRNLLASGEGVTYTYDGFGRRVSATASAGTRTSLYDPAMHLQSETALTGSAIAYDYVWFGDVPVAQEDTTTHWTVTDDLRAPILQTSATGTVWWQAVYAPFGAIYSLATADAHQPLRRPGQEAEEFTTGNPNGLTTRFYNGFRWYRPAYGRYTQADPVGYASGAFSLYAYANADPLNEIDPYGTNGFGAGVGAGIGGAVGSGIGGIVGTALGGAGGTLVAPGFGTIGGAVSLATVGAVTGGTAGVAVGAAVGNWASDALGDIGNYILNQARGPGSQPSDTTAGDADSTTPGGIPYGPQHPGNTPKDPGHNIPGSVVDETVANGSRTDNPDGSKTYYDPNNDVTVHVNPDGSVATAHRGKPSRTKCS
jgi:RHS repeat-associated protein